MKHINWTENDYLVAIDECNSAIKKLKNQNAIRDYVKHRARLKEEMLSRYGEPYKIIVNRTKNEGSARLITTIKNGCFGKKERWIKNDNEEEYN